MARRAVFALLALAQFVSVTPGATRHDDAAVALGSLVGLAAVAVLFARPADRTTPIVVAVLYAGQAALVGPVLPIVAVAAVLLGVARSAVAGSEGDLVGRSVPIALAVVGVTVAAAITGDAATALSYAVVLLLAVVAGLLLAGRTARRGARERELVAAERLRIARDLHDVVGHGLTAITVQAGTGRVALEAGAGAAAMEALAAVETAGRQVLREVRWLVSLLREEDTRVALSDVPALVDGARRCGVDVELVDEAPTAASADVGEAAYRIVQESLTNVLRHAPTASTVVRVSGTDRLVIEVTSTGPVSLAPAEGTGIRGMRERATAVGGILDAGPRPERDAWLVRAELPKGARR